MASSVDQSCRNVLEHFVSAQALLEVAEHEIEDYIQTIVAGEKLDGETPELLQSFLKSWRRTTRRSNEVMQAVLQGYKKSIHFWWAMHSSQLLFSFQPAPVTSYDTRHSSSASRRMFGIGVYSMQEGDRLLMILGCSAPVVVRQRGVHHVLLGTARLLESATDKRLQKKIQRWDSSDLEDVYFC